MAKQVIRYEESHGAEVIPIKSELTPPLMDIFHDESPALITDHKYAPMSEWWTRCRYCRMSEAAHAESEIRYYGDDI